MPFGTGLILAVAKGCLDLFVLSSSDLLPLGKLFVSRPAAVENFGLKLGRIVGGEQCGTKEDGRVDEDTHFTALTSLDGVYSE